MASAAEATGTSNSGWDRHLGLFAGPRDPSRGIANCARRSLNEGPLDPGSIPGSSTEEMQVRKGLPGLHLHYIAKAPASAPTSWLFTCAPHDFTEKPLATRNTVRVAMLGAFRKVHGESAGLVSQW